MLLRSEAFDDAIRGLGPGTYRTRIDAYRAGALKIADVPFVAGNVALDLTAASRRSLQLELVDDDGTLTPTTPTHPLSAYGNELFVRCGFTFPDGSEEMLPMGWFRIVSARPTDGGQISITAEDRSRPISDARWETLYAIPAGTNVGTAIQTAVATRLADLTYDFAGTTTTLPLTVFEEGRDPWRDLTDLAVSDGRELYFNAEGRLVFDQRPDPANVVPVWTYEPGPANIRLAIANDQSIDGVHNVWIVTSEGSSTQVVNRASVEVTDLTSPIHPGVIGRRPRFLASPLAQSAYAAQRIAEEMRRKEGGTGEQVTFSAVPHPAHEPGDVVRVIEPSMGLDVAVVLAKWTFDLRFAQPSTYETLGRRAA